MAHKVFISFKTEDESYKNYIQNNLDIDMIDKSLDEAEPEELKWKYATLSNCYLAIEKADKATEYENNFKDQTPEDWEIATFEKSKQDIINSKK